MVSCSSCQYSNTWWFQSQLEDVQCHRCRSPLLRLLCWLVVCRRSVGHRGRRATGNCKQGYTYYIIAVLFVLTLTSWSWPTPCSVILTNSDTASIESVASVAGVGGHSTHWSWSSNPNIIANHSIGQSSQIRAGSYNYGGWFHCINGFTVLKKVKLNLPWQVGVVPPQVPSFWQALKLSPVLRV